MENSLGLLRITVVRGLKLARRDYKSSDPYVAVRAGNQNAKTRVMYKNLDPEWHEQLILSISDATLPIRVQVYDKDLIPPDDKMGDAEFDINPFIEAVKQRVEDARNGTVIQKLTPGRGNCFSEESFIVWEHGQVIQRMFLKLRNVEHGEIELKLHWIDHPGPREMENSLGLLGITVVRGMKLVKRDSKSSDPYVVIRVGKQKVKTRVMHKNLDPEWNEQLTVSISDATLPIRLEVYDKDMFSRDDKMGDAEFDINPFIEAINLRIDDVPNGRVIRKLTPGRENCFAEESFIVWEHGKVIQRMFLRLRNVEHGEVELKLHWIDGPGSRGF